jgi:hypothetical protein
MPPKGPKRPLYSFSKVLYIVALNSLSTRELILENLSQAYMPPKGPFFDIKKELRTGHKFPLGTFVCVWCVGVCLCLAQSLCI